MQETKEIQNKETLTVGEIIKNSTEAIFSFYRQGYLYYRITILDEDGFGKATYAFPVEVADLGTATVSITEKPITMMRYIRKALENGSFVKAG